MPRARIITGPRSPISKRSSLRPSFGARPDEKCSAYGRDRRRRRFGSGCRRRGHVDIGGPAGVLGRGFAWTSRLRGLGLDRFRRLAGLVGKWRKLLHCLALLALRTPRRNEELLVRRVAQPPILAIGRGLSRAA